MPSLGDERGETAVVVLRSLGRKGGWRWRGIGWVGRALGTEQWGGEWVDERKERLIHTKHITGSISRRHRRKGAFMHVHIRNENI